MNYEELKQYYFDQRKKQDEIQYQKDRIYNPYLNMSKDELAEELKKTLEELVKLGG